MKHLPFLLAAVAAVLLPGCGTLGFYLHNINGHLSMMSKRKPLQEVLDDPATPPSLKEKLRVAQQVRDFSQNKLQLPHHGSYHDYADLKRKYVKWNVIATPELAVEPVTWCFPFTGCVSYRGYYREEPAQQFADKLKTKGLDTHISGAVAYSTLGWFNDPLISPMMHWSRFRTAEFIIHELAHQKLYIANDQDFNEAFATMVADYGMRRWSESNHLGEQWRAYKNRRKKELAFVELALQTREKLAELYRSKLSDTDKRKGKTEILKAMKKIYQMKRKQGEVANFDHWFDGLNNAKFAALASYQRYVPAFYRILAKNKEDLAGFYKKVEDLGALPGAERKAYLEDLLNNP